MERNSYIEHSTEDKLFWCDHGLQFEYEFVNHLAPKIGKNIIIHPNKIDNIKHIDLFDLDKKRVADLKTQNTPFFTAYKYGYDPQFTVTFNRKDYNYYKRMYPEAIIYWLIEWKQTSYRSNKVEYMYGIWEVEFDFMASFIENDIVPLHAYQHRINDTVNAKDSYLFDLNYFDRLL